MFALVAGATVLAVGCSDDKKGDPKPPPGADLKPLAPPPSPGGGGQPNPKAPGAGPNAQ
jgi:hypothetical protein